MQQASPNKKLSSCNCNYCNADTLLELFLKKIYPSPPASGTWALSFRAVLVPQMLVCFVWRTSLEMGIWIPNELRNIFLSYSWLVTPKRICLQKLNCQQGLWMSFVGPLSGHLELIALLMAAIWEIFWEKLLLSFLNLFCIVPWINLYSFEEFPGNFPLPQRVRCQKREILSPVPHILLLLASVPQQLCD